MSGKVIDRAYLLILKYQRLATKHGHEYAIEQFSQKEHDDMFNHVLACHTPENFDEKTGGFRIAKSLV